MKTKRMLGVAAMVAGVVCSGGDLWAAGAVSPLSPPSTGTWKVVGDVQGVAVLMTCALVEADHKLTGACTDDQGTSHTISGDATDEKVTWVFNSEYDGNPITVTMAGKLDVAGAKMAGTIGVDPMGVNGEFSATLQSEAAPSPAGL